MTALYGVTLLLSAGLLFAIQPMIAKAVLPALGGSPAVWTTCLAFFQAALLAGYGYAFALARRLSPRAQVVAHLALLALAVGWVVPVPPGTREPVFPGRPEHNLHSPARWLVAELVRRDGLPLVLIAATAPLLQGWFAAGRRRDPYFLYAASNLGSLVALLAYPLVIEPSLPLPRQTAYWRYGFVLLLGLVALCGITHLPALHRDIVVREGGAPARPRPLRWLIWAALAALPSSLLLGVTQFLTRDLAAVPLLWVVPLSLYLLTYIAAFAQRPWFDAARAARVYPLALMALGPALAAGLVQPFWLWLPLHLLAFALAALGCHGALARLRPPAEHLTAFYLALAAGGAAGGLFNALAAPVLFDRAAEYPLALVLAAVALSLVGERTEKPSAWGTAGAGRSSSGRLFERAWTRRDDGPSPRWSDAVVPGLIFVLIAPLARDVGGFAQTAAGGLAAALATGLVVLACWTYRWRPIRFALAFGAAIAACGLWEGRDGRTLLRHRDLYGIVRVTRDDRARCIRLFHGSTLHGEQSLDPLLCREPRAYFDRTGPAGDLFAALGLRSSPPRVAIVGLGCGTLAAYARPGELWTFFELDPAVIRIARNPRFFTYLADSLADAIACVAGDARLRLEEAPDGSFEAIVLDAFGSDAVPVHLLTREALALYRRKLAPGGLLAFNLSNRYLDLDPVLGALAAEAGMVCRVRYDLDVPRAERQRTGKQPTIWAVVADSTRDLGPIAADSRWRPARVVPTIPAWTDEFSNLFRSLTLGPRAGRRADSGVGPE